MVAVGALSRVDDRSIPTGTAQAVVTGAQHSDRAGFRQDMLVIEVEGTRTEDHRALRRRVRLSFDLSVCVVAMVVLVFELCWRYAAEVVEEAAVVEPVDPVCCSASDTIRTASEFLPGTSPADSQGLKGRPPICA
jgi:hypothetical protein